ncbi:MAG: hypothetical protein LBO77_07045 [Desulfovibrio sp.]|nr:hypothetical protein [Desulfovibrio sp.]
MKSLSEYPGKVLWERAHLFLRGCAAYALIPALCLPAPAAFAPTQVNAAACMRSGPGNEYSLFGQAGPNVFRFRVLNGFAGCVAGQTVRAAAAGAYLADAEPTQPATLNGNATQLNGLVVTFSGGGSFTVPGSQGYQSVVSMTVKKYASGVEDTSWAPGGSVTWTVTSAISGLSLGTEGVWKRAASAKNGLMWVASATDSVPGTTDWSTDMIQGAPPAGATAYLADIVGSRTITVTVADSGDSSGGQTFTFGQGPLSVFSKTGTGGVDWAEKSQDIASYPANGFQDTTNVFPAASFCGGTVRNDVTVTGSSGPDSSGFTPGAGGGWSGEHLTVGDTSYKARYAEPSKLAKPDQLLAVSVYHAGYNSGVQRKGAAQAAGWLPLGGYNYAWAGEVDFYGNGFNAVVVYLGNGVTDYWPVVFYAYPVAVCLP